MGAILSLESFDDGSLRSSTTDKKAVGSYDDGYRDGWVAAEMALAEKQTHVRASLTESLNDANFGYLEAQAHFLAGMNSYVTALVEAVLPALLSPAFNAQLCSVLLEAIERDASGPISIRLPPDQIQAFQLAVDDLDLARVTFVPDETLTDHAAIVCGPNSETALDLDGVLQVITEHSAILLTPSQKAS
ncbi:hypothetical protein FHS72_000033 [Loktanella ponticola]|uniref:Flagellar biosynthesis protein n=1 Tax=Yoonia ponticola TaxID=1524255 RepID=A0A7W9EWB3_9RHOB|nr:hypothetical protein [Yoonia ponticola]MBB5720429.1 hypothetical protein [Yoonia ponticola]